MRAEVERVVRPAALDEIDGVTGGFGLGSMAWVMSVRRVMEAAGWVVRRVGRGRL
jgi:capsular polysaccharide biosynthesis protein